MGAGGAEWRGWSRGALTSWGCIDVGAWRRGGGVSLMKIGMK
ncbi:hypothetical protein chiPu_0017197, partial [Chiloscyllium punctatum]|nr:hypothetical protein [Chiloscyllium punctatum]